tara:strand:+ start:181 stop:525 length:345 start_codon:yes stop_codon:yes gene_type:complete
MKLTTVGLYTYLLDLWADGGRLHYYNGSTWDIELNKKRYTLDNNFKTLHIQEGASAERYFQSSGNVLECETDSVGRQVEFGRLIKVAMLSTMDTMDERLNPRETIPYNIDQDAF